jgi:SAM-dependent methyltransferase
LSVALHPDTLPSAFGDGRHARLDQVSRERWNSNLHAFEQLIGAIPDGAQRGLDVGCGEGETARRLRRKVPEVVGLDPDVPSIEQARSCGDDIEYVVGDLDSADLPEASFDVVTAVAMLHHVDQRVGLTQLGRLVRPGGMLLVVGLARSRSLLDFGRDAFDALAMRRHSLRTGVWETPSPKLWPPPLTYGEARDVSLDALPGARCKRIPYFRYGLTWARGRS